MYVAVIELDTTIAPKVVLGHTVQAMNRRIAEILTDHGTFTPETETFLRQHPAPLDEPAALREWLQQFHDEFTQPWVSTYITTQSVPMETAIEAVDNTWTGPSALIPFSIN